MKNKDVIEVISLSEKLIGFLNKETSYLHQMRVADFSLMQDEKFSLVNAYEQRSQRLKKALQNGLEVSKEELEILKEKMQAVNEVVAINKQSLQAMNEVNNRLIKALIDAISAENETVCGYERDGKRRKARKIPAIPLSVHVNKNL